MGKNLKKNRDVTVKEVKSKKSKMNTTNIIQKSLSNIKITSQTEESNLIIYFRNVRLRYYRHNK